MKHKDYVASISPYALLDGIKHSEENYMLDQHDKEVLLDMLNGIENYERIIASVEDLLQLTAVNYFCRGIKMGASLSMYINPLLHDPED